MIQIFLDCLHLDRTRFPLDKLLGLDDAQWRELITLAAGHRVTAVFYNRVASALSESGYEFTSTGIYGTAKAHVTTGTGDDHTIAAGYDHTSKTGHDDPSVTGYGDITGTGYADTTGTGTTASTSNSKPVLPKPFRMAMDELREHTTRITEENLSKQADLKRILRRFSAEGIPVILLKGAWLAHSAYDGSAVREMADLDLMVPAVDLERAARAVMALGWRPHRTIRDIATEMRNKHHLPIMTREGAAAVELHWNLTHEKRRDYVPPDGLWERSHGIRVAWEPARALSREDMLLHLCLHLAYQHMFTFGIRPVLDVALFLQKSEAATIDWQQLTQRAIDYRWHRGVWITLQLARDLFGAPVRQVVLDELMGGDMRLPGQEGASGTRIAQTAGSRVDRGSQPAAEKPNSAELARTAAEQLLALYYTRNFLSSQMVSMAHKKGVLDKIRHVLSRIFLPRERMCLLYDIPAGSMRVWLYYPVRVVGLLRRQLGFAFGMMRGEEEVMGHVARRERLRHYLQGG